MRSLLKLSQHGITHLVVPLAVVLILAVSGTVFYSVSHALTRNPYPCPNQPTLYQGVYNPTCVRHVQWLLRNFNLNNYQQNRPAVNGAFDTATKLAVKDFQTNHHLYADGVVGQQTWAALSYCYNHGSCS